jgi:hypothetical protein
VAFLWTFTICEAQLRADKHHAQSLLPGSSHGLHGVWLLSALRDCAQPFACQTKMATMKSDSDTCTDAESR